MADVHSPEQRRKNMQAVRQSNTKPEILIRRLLHARGFRFRLNVRKLPGSPDLVFAKYHAVVFVHGCFWHGHDCYLFRLPETRRDFWEKKINANRERDVRAVRALRDQGWRVLTVWECAARGRYRLPENLLTDEIAAWLICSSHEPGHSMAEIECREPGKHAQS